MTHGSARPPALAPALTAASLFILALAAPACGGQSSDRDAPARPAATVAPEPERLRQSAEAQHLARMQPALAALVREQSWFRELTPAGLDLVAAIRQCELAARARSEDASVPAVLEYASRQAWYAEGLDERETRALAGLFRAYAESLRDDNAWPIGPMIATTLLHGLFDVLSLPETGPLVVLASAEDAALGRQALRLATQALPAVEQVVGRYPYAFLYIEVSDDLPPGYAGLSYDAFIALSSDAVDAGTVIHELTHSTVYGLYPLWFEEGLAHFLEYYLTGVLDYGVRGYTAFLRQAGRDARLDVRHRPGYSTLDALAERAQGFLFLNALYEAQGIEGLSKTIRTLRTRTFTSQELLAAIYQHAAPEARERVGRVLCDRVSGSTRDFCSPA